VIIDVHGHYTKVPPELDAYRGRQILQLARGGVKGNPGISDDQLKATLQVHLDAMALRGVDQEIFSPRAAFMGHEFGSETISRNWTEVNNDLIARAAAMYPEQFVPACQLPQSPGVSPANALGELERCVGMGFVGCNINPDVSGGVAPLTPSLGDRWWYPLWEKMCELDVPGLIHAGSTLNPHLHMNGAHYVNTDVAAVVELTTSRVLTDFPDLKLIIPHGGGGIPFHWNRLRSLAAGRSAIPFEESVRRLYFDLAVYDDEAMNMTIRRMGPDNVVFATEMLGTAQAIDPVTGRPFDDTLALVRDLDWLSAEDKHKIFEGNARRLYSRADF
jgi:4-oxalmesaconate hydratase